MGADYRGRFCSDCLGYVNSNLVAANLLMQQQF